MIRTRRFFSSLLLPTLLLLMLYAITRLTWLTKLPIFTDEAIYIRWSQIGSRDASWRFISLVDGKQPLFTWIMMVVLRFIGDPLFAGRFVSVLAGVGSLVGLWFLAVELFSQKRVGIIASALYLLSPFALMYDRLALYDSLVAALSIWNLYLAILLVRRVRLDVALLFGMALGLGMLNKTSGFLSLYMVPATLVLFDWNHPHPAGRLFRWIGLVVLAALVSGALYSILRLSPLFHMVKAKDAVFVYPWSEWITHPMRFFSGNMQGLFDWVTHYLTWPIFLIAIIPLTGRANIRERLLLYGWWLAPLVALGLFARILYPRFILFMCMPLFVLAAVHMDYLYGKIQKPFVGLLVFGIVLLPSLYTDYFIITDPLHAPIPISDKTQYIDDWPSGWGVGQVNAYLLRESQKGPIAVYTDGTFGLMPYALEIYLVDKPNIKISSLWPLSKDIPQVMQLDAQTKPTFFVMNQTQVSPAWPLTLIAQYQKGNRTDMHMRLYQVVPSGTQTLH